MTLDKIFASGIELSNSTSGKPDVRFEIELVGELHQLKVRLDWWKEDFHVQRIFTPDDVMKANVDIIYRFTREASHAYNTRISK